MSIKNLLYIAVSVSIILLLEWFGGLVGWTINATLTTADYLYDNPWIFAAVIVVCFGSLIWIILTAPME